MAWLWGRRKTSAYQEAAKTAAKYQETRPAKAIQEAEEKAEEVYKTAEEKGKEAVAKEKISAGDNPEKTSVN